jgi:prepilin-type N-terminal cleavage/methylation domain-containing protein
MCRRRKRFTDDRAGLTLVELMMAVAIMGIMAGAMSMLAASVQQGAAYNEGRGASLQHARVVFDRINRMVNSATTAPTHPGVGVVVTTSGSNLYPDTLIVWTPANGTPTNPGGPPLVKECTIYCPDPNTPSQLVEITAPSDSTPLPLDSTLNTTAGQAQVAAIKTASTSKKTLLTDLLRTASTSTSSNGSTSLCGAVRFNLDLYPSTANYSSYLAGTSTWISLPWPRGMYSSTFGLRQVYLHTELQLMPKNRKGQQDTSGSLPVPFYNSNTLYYMMSP